MASLRKLLFSAATVLLILPSKVASFNWTTCETRDSMVCNCTSTVLINVITRCQFLHVTDLKYVIVTSKDVARLNLSWNNIQYIPRNSFQNFSNLIYLSLSSNNISAISEGAFTGLAKLRELNLEDNVIKQWDTKLIQQDLPNLAILNIAQNIHWKPDQQILSLPNLKIIYLLITYKPRSYWWLFKCYLVRRDIEKILGNKSIFAEKIPSSIKQSVTPNVLLLKADDCWRSKLFFRDASFWNIIDEGGFYFHCKRLIPSFVLKSIPKRHFSHLQQQNSWYFTRQVETSYCFNSIGRIHSITLIEGICALVLNLFVVMTTLRSRVLQESVAHILVANIAVGDLFIAIYMIIITLTRQIMDVDKYSWFYITDYCRIVGLFFLIGQISSPLMSFIMTLERYLAVVYCMRPHIRITGRMCYVAMVTVWGSSISLAVSFMISPNFSNETDSMCIPLENTDKMNILQYIGGIGVGLYILSMTLYGHLYLDFRKTNQKTVQLQRENRVARRIALIMFTNVLFFILPLIFILIISSLRDYILYVNRYIFSKTFGIIFLGINSCLNPILFSFRNETFRTELRRRCLVCRRSVGPQP